MTLLCVGCAVASASAKEEEPGVRGTRVGRQECGEGKAGNKGKEVVLRMERSARGGRLVERALKERN